MPCKQYRAFFAIRKEDLVNCHLHPLFIMVLIYRWKIGIKLPNPWIQKKTKEKKKGILHFCETKYTVTFISKLNQIKGNEALYDILQFVVYAIALICVLKTLTSVFSLWRFRGPSRSFCFACRESTGKDTIMARCQLSKWKSRTLFQIES
jgi:hypothetical protein